MNIRFTTRILAACAALAVAGCGGADDTPNPAADGTELSAADTESVDGSDDGHDAEKSDAPALDVSTDEDDGPQQPPFDPAAEIRPADIEARPWGTGDVERPYELLVLPDDFVLPATAVPVTWAPPEEPFNPKWKHGGSGAFHLFEADPADVAAFFTGRLEDQGWELVEERDDGEDWDQKWSTVTGWDGWEKDWQHDEMGVEVEVRLVHLASDDGDHSGTLQFHYGAESVRR